MASSPPPAYSYNGASSPSYPSSAQSPQSLKRRQSDIPSSASTIKRRKASMASNASTHPLRQTSFPPPESMPQSSADSISRVSRSLSADTMVSGSAIGRPAKRQKTKKTVLNDDNSTADLKSIASGSGGKKTRPGDASADEEEEYDNGEAVPETMTSQEEKARDNEARALLVRNLDPAQLARYELMRAGKLNEAVTRRIVNVTLSQSTAAPVINAIRAFGKLHAGDIIEGARKIQTKWIIASGRDQLTGEPFKKDADGNDIIDPRRGPLEPEHLREAARLYQLDNPLGGVGALNLVGLQACSGIDRFGTRTQGRRLFK